MSLCVPAGHFAVAALTNRADVRREGRETVIRTAAIMREHARKVFETQELALARVEDRIRDLSWEEIGRPEISAFLASLAESMEQAVSIWVTDRDGVVRAGSQPWNPAVTITQREFFQYHKAGGLGPHVSAAFRGMATNVASFAVSHRLNDANGAFDGIVHIALDPDYFARFFAEAAPGVSHVASLIRADGEILARQPPSPGTTRLSPDSPLLRAISAQPQGGFFEARSPIDGRQRMYAYARLGSYPIYVDFGADTEAVMQRWRTNMLLYGSVAGATALLLLLATWLAMRRATAERAATDRLRRALEELRRETAGRQAAENRVRQAQRMEALGQLAGGIAHDVNNVLQAAASGARLIRRKPGDEAQVERLAGMILEATERGASVARRLLAFARQGELRAADVDAAAMLEGLREVLGHTLGAGIAVRTRIAPDLPPLRADKAQLETVLLNLATNARDAMAARGDGTLVLGVEEELVASGTPHPAGLAPGAYLRLSVSDTGVGMDAATLARATEPFFSTKPEGSGTGLGLAMAKGFAEQSGGGLALQSEPNVGTTVTLWLPRGVALPQALPELPRRKVAAVSPVPHVLLVDDEALVRETMAAELAARGWCLTEAADGQAALRIIESAIPPPDLLVTDLAMPGMNGLALLAEARRRRPGLPAVLVTGLVGDSAAAHAALAQAVRDGPFALLRKPVDMGELATRAAALLHSAGASPE